MEGRAIRDRILVVDHDPDVRAVVDVTLGLAGYEVIAADEGSDAVELALRQHPDLVLVDAMTPEIDHRAVCRKLRRDGRVAHIPIIMLTSKPQLSDGIADLTYDADDFITRPFDTTEFVARVQATLRRARDTRSLSPLTGLPGQVRIEQELARRVAADEPLAVLYADLDHFKGYNDHYGFLRGDQAIRTFADVLREAAEIGAGETFVGHVGGDDFLVITTPQHAEPMAAAIVAGFERRVPALYDEVDWRAGYIEVEDRQGRLHRHPHLSVSVGVATTARRRFVDHRELSAVATEMKDFAKHSTAGASNYAVDRRSN